MLAIEAVSCCYWMLLYTCVIRDIAEVLCDAAVHYFDDTLYAIREIMFLKVCDVHYWILFSYGLITSLSQTMHCKIVLTVTHATFC